MENILLASETVMARSLCWSLKSSNEGVWHLSWVSLMYSAEVVALSFGCPGTEKLTLGRDVETKRIDRKEGMEKRGRQRERERECVRERRQRKEEKGGCAAYDSGESV